MFSFNKKAVFYTQVLGILFFSIYAFLSLFFYKERTLSFDSAAFVFEIIQTKTFFLPLGRWGSFLSQIIPLIFVKNGASLDVILHVYSFNFTLFYYCGFLIITLALKNHRVGIVYLLTLCLSYRNTFYFSASELSQGLALTVVLYAILIHALRQQTRKRVLFFVVCFFLGISLYYFHQLLIVAVITIFCLLAIEFRRYKILGLIIVFFSIITWFGLNIYYLPKESYEAEKIPSLSVFVEQLPNFFELPSFQYFSYFFRYQLIFPTLIFIVCLIFLLRKKKVKSVLFLLAGVLGYIILIIITYYRGESPNMYEQYYTIIGFFIALSIGLVLKEIKTTLFTLVAIGIMIVYSWVKIYEAHECPTKRLNYLSYISNQGKKYNNRKFIIKRDNLPWGFVWSTWAIPVETIMISSLKDKKNGVTFYVPEENEPLKLMLSDGQLHSVQWQRHHMNTNILDTFYFHIPKNTPYLVTKNITETLYFIENNLKYNIPYRSDYIEKAKERGVSFEEMIRIDALYLKEKMKNEKTK